MKALLTLGIEVKCFAKSPSVLLIFLWVSSLITPSTSIFFFKMFSSVPSRPRQCRRQVELHRGDGGILHSSTSLMKGSTVVKSTPEPHDSKTVSKSPRNSIAEWNMNLDSNADFDAELNMSHGRFDFEMISCRWNIQVEHGAKILLRFLQVPDLIDSQNRSCENVFIVISMPGEF